MGPNHPNPRFFKVFLPDLCSHRLEIAPAFRKHIAFRLPTTCSVLGPSGHAWAMEMVEDGRGGVWFGGGWEVFARDNRLGVGDFMVFEWRGERRFKVVVLDPSGCEKVEALEARPGMGWEAGAVRVGRELIVGFGGEGGGIGVETDGGGALVEKGVFGAPKPQSFRVLLSRRRPVTMEEIQRARYVAESFTSNNPFFVRAIRKSDIYFHHKMYVPSPFSKIYLPKECSNMILRIPNGKTYGVRIYNKNGKGPYITAGWRAFTVENNLEEYDACVFELINKHEFQVYIHRVVEEITPATWAIVNKLS